MEPSRLTLPQHSSSSPRQKRLFHRSQRSHATPCQLRRRTLVYNVDKKKRHHLVSLTKKNHKRTFCKDVRLLPEDGVGEVSGDDDGEGFSDRERASHCEVRNLILAEETWSPLFLFSLSVSLCLSCKLLCGMRRKEEKEEGLYRGKERWMAASI